MANTKFLEPGGDSDFGVGFWGFLNGTPTVATDFVHGGHVKSIKFTKSTSSYVATPNGAVADAGGRISFWIYYNALPGANDTICNIETANDGSDVGLKLRITSGGVLQLFNGASQVGSNGSTLSAGTWYRLTYTWTITSSTVNTFKTFVNGVADITVSNQSLPATNSSCFYVGNATGDATADVRVSDVYIDDSNALTDPGNIWVTAKRPNSNGTTNGFTTQIGSGGSGYGTGHSPQVNERPNSDSNGWSVIGAGSAVTEEYNIEGKSVGDIDISSATIVDYMGWVRTKALVSETGQIIVNNVTSNISITTSAAFFTQAAGSSTYPAGTGTDIGEITSTTVTTVSLYECGIMVAYIPAVASSFKPKLLPLLGVG